ncbi:MAG: hypothetical protein ACOC9Y_07685 [Chloroflexota bacterium]
MVGTQAAKCLIEHYREAFVAGDTGMLDGIVAPDDSDHSAYPDQPDGRSVSMRSRFRRAAMAGGLWSK